MKKGVNCFWIGGEKGRKRANDSSRNRTYLAGGGGKTEKRAGGISALPTKAGPGSTLFHGKAPFSEKKEGSNAQRGNRNGTIRGRGQKKRFLA